MDRRDALTLLPRLCGTCKHWEGLVDGLGYSTCLAQREPSEAEREILRKNALPDTHEGLVQLVGPWARTARQDCNGRWWEPEEEQGIRQCLPLMGLYAPVVQAALEAAAAPAGEG